jgi:predicted DNA-binding mobile mystery protein A
MRPDFRDLRINQLDKALAPFTDTQIIRPRNGWIRAIRQATGLSLRQLALRLGKSLTLVARLEKSEADYRITLESLRNAAEAMNCRLVYALVPKHGTLSDVAEADAKNKATEIIRSVEHSMALEEQAVGDVDDFIAQETKRLLGRRRK